MSSDNSPGFSTKKTRNHHLSNTSIIFFTSALFPPLFIFTARFFFHILFPLFCARPARIQQADEINTRQNSSTLPFFFLLTSSFSFQRDRKQSDPLSKAHLVVPLVSLREVFVCVCTRESFERETRGLLIEGESTDFRPLAKKSNAARRARPATPADPGPGLRRRGRGGN